MDALLKGFAVGWTLFLQTVPVLLITTIVAFVLAWIFGQRRFVAPGEETETVLPWYKVHDQMRVFSTVAAIAAFGSFQGYLVGSIGFQDADKTIASLIAGAVTFLSTIIALFYTKDAPESFKQAIAPGIIAFLLCFMTFSGYQDRIRPGGIPDATPVDPILEHAAEPASGGG
jgi:hypothetical protein